MKKHLLVIEKLAPSWFACVMGTGIVAITSFYYSQNFLWLRNLSTLLWILNVLLFALLIIPWTLRLFIYREKALSDLREPTTGQFYATMPISCLVLAADFLIIGTHSMDINLAIGLAKGLWILGTLIAVLFAVIIPMQNILNPDVRVENISPAWFMPPVGLIVIPISGAKLIPYWPDSWQQIMLILNYVFWGSGFFLFLFIEAICIYRFICRPPLPGHLAPTIWINIGPIGAGTIALINLSYASTPFLGESVVPVLNLFAIFFWGFGFWWIINAVLLTIFYFKQNNLPFSLSWWAFTFPLGAYTGATYLIASFVKSPAVNIYGFCCYLLLLFVWLCVFVRTIIGVGRMEFFK
ncbi:MAG: C4-dicarboxylate ABC transporter [Peptococcaceae bacterium BRH_c4b]|nr:MAG: C4-dicarboxylate ABC transporter [Peptococcaceae bacterium BRH_c4b]